MKGISLLISSAGLAVGVLGFSAVVSAGSGCNYGVGEIAQAEQSDVGSGLLMGSIDKAPVDPKWLALLRQQESDSKTIPAPVVVHN